MLASCPARPLLSRGEIFVLEAKNADIDSWLVIKIETLLFVPTPSTQNNISE